MDLQSLLINDEDEDRKRLLSLKDIFVAGDDELMQWWLHTAGARMNPSFFPRDKNVPAVVSSSSMVAPRAEIFCFALLRSIQEKGPHLFRFFGPVSTLCGGAAALYAICRSCSYFLYRLARDKLVQRTKKREVAMLESNLREWIEMINGTHMATLLLLPEDADTTDTTTSAGLSGDPQDLIRFGRSLQSLETVLVEEFTKAFVETLLLEHARLASYLMQSSSFLAWDEEEILEQARQSPDFAQAQRLFRVLVRVCNVNSSSSASNDDDQQQQEARELAHYAPKRMLDSVLTLLSTKLLEVALDWQDMTPDLLVEGSTVFCHHVESLFAGVVATTNEGTLRLLNVTTLLQLPSTTLAQLGNTLCGLADAPAPLAVEHFTMDDQIYAQAMDMIRLGKGWKHVELEDVLSILNRRRDL